MDSYSIFSTASSATGLTAIASLFIRGGRKVFLLFLGGVLLGASPGPLSTAAYGEEGRGSEELVNIMVMPFKVYSPGDISRERRAIMGGVGEGLDIMGARIVGEDYLRDLAERGASLDISEEEVIKAGRVQGGDFVLLGSISHLGKGFDVNMRALDLRSGGAVSFYSVSGLSIEGLRSRVIATMPLLYDTLVEVLHTRAAQKEGPIDRIIVTGNRRVDEDAVIRRLASRVGDDYSPEVVREDIKAIFSMGYFEDVVVNLADTSVGKVLFFKLKELPFVSEIVLDGNEEVEDDIINEAISLKKNGVLDMAKVSEDVKVIKILYGQEGYYLADVKPVLDKRGSGVKVTYKVTEGPEVKVKRITIIGNEAVSDKRLRKEMKTKEKGFFSVVSGSGKYNEFLFSQDLQRITSYYQDRGYMEVDVKDYRVLLSEDKRWFYITIALDEGRKYRIGDVSVIGYLIKDREVLLEAFKVGTGDLYKGSAITKGVGSVGELYRDEGYANADIRPVTKVNEEEGTVDLTLQIRKNELVYIEKIEITGNKRTRDKVIRRELELEEGALFSSSGLKKSSNNLRRLGYFETVDIRPSQGSSPNRMRLDVAVKERNTGSFSAGLGFSSVDSLIASLSLSFKNFMGKGIKLDLSGNVSGNSSKYNISVTEPWLFDNPISGGFDLYNSSRDFPDFSSYKKGFALRAGMPYRGSRYTRLFAAYRLEEVEVFDIQDTSSVFIKAQEGITTTSSIKATVRHDTRDDAFFPRDGILTSLSVEYAGGALMGDNDYTKYDFNYSKYYGLPWNTALSYRVVMGYVQARGEEDTPITERYFLGGINTVRGFKSREVGPVDPVQGEHIGGNTMFLFNTEYIFPIGEGQSLKGVLFFDAGNAYTRSPGLGVVDPTTLRLGAGGGIRWFSPVGPLRIELGFNLDPKEGEERSVWEFTAGTSF